MVQDAKLLEGRHALITGASRGIGKGIAIGFAEEGANLYLCARNAEQLAEVAEECKKSGAQSVTTMSVDLLSTKSVDELAEQVDGKIDVLVINAGMHDNATVLEGDPDLWDTLLQLNLGTPMRLTRRLAPKMAGKPNHAYIINISSIAGLRPTPGEAVYAASKWGFQGFSVSTFAELKSKNINTVAICPELVATEMATSRGGNGEEMIQVKDVAQAALLAFRMTPRSCPTEIVVRNAI